MVSLRGIVAALKSSDGRIRVTTLLGVSGLVAALAMFLVLPAIAGSGAPSGSGVQPTEVSYGGGSGACAVFSDAALELHINNPSDGTFTGPDGTRFSLDVYSGDKKFDFEVVNNPAMAVNDVIINGGSKNTHYDYDASIGAVRDDSELHAPTKGNGNNLFSLSHINICYDTAPVADLSVTKAPRDAIVDVGDEVTFDIIVSNAGPLDATNVKAVDTLPTGMAFLSASDGGAQGPVGTVTWEFANLASGASKTLMLTVTITEDAAGQELINAVSVSGDQDDPTEDNDDAVSVPPVTVTAEVSGTKFHDRDTDGEQDTSNEPALLGWTITAFDAEGAGSDATTDSDGNYTIAGLQPGDYTVCELTTTSGLGAVIGGPLSGGDPETVGGFNWAWTQSDLSLAMEGGGPKYPAYTVGVCGDGYEPNGHVITVDGNLNGIDFGNHTQLSVTCGTEPVVVSLGGPEDSADDPLVTATFPANCTSDDFTTSFDVGRSNDGDEWDQFFVFGGDPDSTTEITLETVWDAEEATYVDNSLVVPTTQVELAPGGGLQPEVFCNSAPGLPNSGTPICLDSRTIAEGGDLPAGYIQLTEISLVLGDPRGFR